MRTVLYGAACSLDGYIAGESDEVDWLAWSRDVERISREVWDATDVVLMGRRTYEVAVRGGIIAYPGVHNYVFSRTLQLEEDIPNLTIVRADAPAFVRELKQQPGKDICVMGGGKLARSLFAAQLIDEVGLNVHPILLGGGIAMFPPPGRRSSWQLSEARPLQGDCFYLRYRAAK
jgi:dihydrofolate reductase